MLEPAATPTKAVRSISQKIAFWLCWVVLLLPALYAIYLLFTTGREIFILFLLSGTQLFIHDASFRWFSDSNKPFSKVMLLLLGATGLVYFLVISCILIFIRLLMVGF